jgi:hypothetical protein
MAIHELVEHIEHAKGHAEGGGHGGGHGGGPGKGIGITMALLGVMLAFCAAMVGAARTELIATMVEQSNKLSIYQAESMKARVMEADVEMLHAITPTKAEVDKFEAKLMSIKRVSGKSDDEDTSELKEAIAVSAKELADVLTPDPEDEAHLANLAKRYAHDTKEAKEDAECYDEKIAAHFDAAEWYERAQLAAEIGIVIASVALLLSSRGVWFISLFFAVAGAGVIVRTFVHTHGMLESAERKIEEAQKKEAFIENDEDGDGVPDKPAAPAASGSAAPGGAKEPPKTEPKKE